MGEPSECIHARVQAARNIQTKRYSNILNSVLALSTLSPKGNIVCNADIGVGEIRQYCRVGEDGQSLMRAATCIARCRTVHDPAQSIGAGAGTAQCHRTRSLKLARMIANSAGSGEIQSVHLAETPPARFVASS